MGCEDDNDDDDGSEYQLSEVLESDDLELIKNGQG
jgi:hypothetical protein